MKTHWCWRGKPTYGASCRTGIKRVTPNIREVTCRTCQRHFLRHTERMMLGEL